MKQQEYFTNNNAYYSPGACGDNESDINTNLFSGQSIIQDDFFNLLHYPNNNNGFYG